MAKEKEIDKKIELCKKLGAAQFQKIVFNIETLKFKILKKIMPNYLNCFDKHIDRLTKKRLKDAKSEEEKQTIIYKAKMDKMIERREFYQERNRNYHINKDNPTEILKYLELNKKIHIDGLIKNAIFGSIMIPGIIFGSTFALVIFIFELLEACINFECINLQNYNICRLTKIADKMRIREERKKTRDAERYKDVAKEIHEAVMEKDEIPSIDDVLARADTPEKLEQLKALLLKVKSERNIHENQAEKGKEKVIK